MAIRVGNNPILKFYAGPVPYVDPDAQAFFNAVTSDGGTLTSTEESAVNTLVISLKADSLWTPLQAIYPLVGGTSGSMKWNLKDPQDTNAAYRMTWAGTGWTFDANGVKQSDSGTTYGNTNYSASTNDNTVGMSMGVYINGGTNAAGYDLGARTEPNELQLIAGFGNNTYYTGWGAVYGTYSGATMPNGFFSTTGDGTNGNKGYRNGVEVISVAGSRNLSVTATLYLGNRNGGIGDSATDRRYAFCFIGEKLTGTQHADLYTIVQTFETTLGRQV